ncbi:DUF1214 domain-containing protein [Thalassotalea fonticola]|uniref:DUF1214 domain-containing protein n=1 Tax=Thalassotalea fonticola TaxID=3065649 RepID=A0ABZ0GS35_9GAMM|nr:DUF1214 domain-containing protein [Colwelliaceae bacterium S1-1]
MSKKFHIIILALHSLISCGEHSATPTPNAPTKIEAETIVTEDNFVRAASDIQMQNYIKRFSNLGRFHHNRWMYDLNNQVSKRVNLDTIYSFAIVDLNSPVEITMPDTNGKYQSLMVVSQEHSITTYYQGTHILSQKSIGSRYAFMLIRTFVDKTDKESLLITHQLQNAVQLKQDDIGNFSVPQYEQASFDKISKKIMNTGTEKVSLRGYFGHVDQIEPKKHRYGAAYGWGGLPEKDAIYEQGKVDNPDGLASYFLTVESVPVDAFWSISIYNEHGLFEPDESAVYSINSTTAEKNIDGSVTIHFGRSGSKNNLAIFNNWNYVVRLYQPRAEILRNEWFFPTPSKLD